MKRRISVAALVMSKPNVYLCALLLLLFSSCKQDEITGSSSGSRGLLPLATGNRWDYAVTRLDASGSVIDRSTATMSIAGEATLGSFTGYSIKELIFFLFGVEQLVATNRNDGLYTATAYNEPIAIPSSQPHASVDIARALAFPTFIGDSLVYRAYHIRTSALNEITKVPAGTFRCIVYTVTVRGDTLAMIWATPGVGFVRMWQQLGSVWEFKELTGYQVQWVPQIPMLWGMSQYSTESAFPHLPPSFEARVSPNKNATLFSGGIAGLM